MYFPVEICHTYFRFLEPEKTLSRRVKAAQPACEILPRGRKRMAFEIAGHALMIMVPVFVMMLVVTLLTRSQKRD